MFGLFKKFQAGLAKTFSALAAKTHGLFGGRRIDAASLDELEEALHTADFGVQTTGEILAEIKAAYRQDAALQGRQAAEIGAAVLARALAGSEGRLEGGDGTPGHPADLGAPSGRALPLKPAVIALIGVNGSGKTTTTAKLGWRLQQAGKTVTLAACDTFRAAAVEQLKSWATRLDLELIASRTGADAAAVAFDAMQSARARGRDFLIVDTAGRLHTKDNLMGELAKIRRVLQKTDPAAPHHAWLVVDGSLGSNSVEQARVFHKSFGLTGLVVTKLDGTSRGGAIVAIWRELRLPIYFTGLGEQPEDLQPFDAASYARAVFGLEEKVG
jgi:fused signal recognition particle receptor